jgi:hypothetical protein
MNSEFHYYAVHALALEAGFDEERAFIIANSSQEVDAATTPLAFDTPTGRVDIIVSQNYLFWDESVKRDIYLPFHFLPGDPKAASASRKDGRTNPYAVTPNSEAAKELLVMALRDKDPYLIGVALHTFADTWAHQNFCGLLGGWNDVGGSSITASLPPAGHLQALSSPDEPSVRWEDPRLLPDRSHVVNRVRFADAAKKIFRYLRVFLGKGFGDDELVVAKLEALWAKPNRDERLADYVICWNMRPYEPLLWRREAGAPDDNSPFAGVRHYDKLAWAKAQLAKAAGSPARAPVPVPASFRESPLYKWHQAALEHRRRALAIIERSGL